jgi:hypothetical protein
MKTKIFLYITISSITIIGKLFWLSVLVCGLSLIDILFGLYLVYKLKEEPFSLERLIEGFLKMAVYIIIISLAYMVSENIFDGSLFQIKHFTPKIVTILFLWLESESIDKKRVRLGKKPISQEIREKIKYIKEIKKNIQEAIK